MPRLHHDSRGGGFVLRVAIIEGRGVIDVGIQNVGPRVDRSHGKLARLAVRPGAGFPRVTVHSFAINPAIKGRTILGDPPGERGRFDALWNH